MYAIPKKMINPNGVTDSFNPFFASLTVRVMFPDIDSIMNNTPIAITSCQFSTIHCPMVTIYNSPILYR